MTIGLGGMLDKHVSSPEKLFAKLWLIASQWDPTTGLLAESSETFRKSVAKILEHDDGQAVTKAIQARLATANSLDAKARGKVLDVMLEIDQAFGKIHPRRCILSTFPTPHLSKWLRDAAEFRTSTLQYGLDVAEGYRLIPRGPLIRSARRPEASNGYSFADLFAYLELVPAVLTLNRRKVSIKHLFISGSVSGGVSSGPSPKYGEETVTAIPIAEISGDFKPSLVTNEKINLIDYKVTDSLNPAVRMHAAMLAAGESHISIAPEFVMPESQAKELASLLRNQPVQSALIVAGSGPSEATHGESGLPWNNSSVMNRTGKHLWTQRKLWPAGVSKDRAKHYGVELPNDGLGYEASASGSEVVICDVEHIGRCVLLICQDLEGDNVTSLVSNFQPDWIFSPILDPGIEVGKWAHQRLFSVSSASQARFIVACSTSLKIPDHSTDNCVLLITPKAGSEKDSRRGVSLRPIERGSAPGYVRLCWKNIDWGKSSLGIE